MRSPWPVVPKLLVSKDPLSSVLQWSPAGLWSVPGLVSCVSNNAVFVLCCSGLPFSWLYCCVCCHTRCRCCAGHSSFHDACLSRWAVRQCLPFVSPSFPCALNTEFTLTEILCLKPVVVTNFSIISESTIKPKARLLILVEQTFKGKRKTQSGTMPALHPGLGFSAAWSWHVWTGYPFKRWLLCVW